MRGPNRSSGEQCETASCWNLLLWLHHAAKILAADGQGAQALAGGGEDRIGDGWLDRGRTWLADATPSFAGRGRDVDFRLRRILQAHHRVSVKIALLDAAVLDRNLAEQRRGKPVD